MDNVCSCAFGLYKGLKARCGPLVHQSAFSGHLKTYKPKDWLAATWRATKEITSRFQCSTLFGTDFNKQRLATRPEIHIFSR